MTIYYAGTAGGVKAAYFTVLGENADTIIRRALLLSGPNGQLVHAKNSQMVYTNPGFMPGISCSVYVEKSGQATVVVEGRLKGLNPGQLENLIEVAVIENNLAEAGLAPVDFGPERVPMQLGH